MSRTSPAEFSIEIGEIRTHNVQPLLHEIRHALTRWLDTGESTIIDLRSIPMAPGEEDELVNTLGTGEIHARLMALGKSDIIETRFPGLWLVTHYNNNDEVIGKFLEVCDMPPILKAQEEDIRDGLERLETGLGQAPGKAHCDGTGLPPPAMNKGR